MENKRIRTMEDVIEVMDKIMFGMEDHYFTHQYHQVLQIHRETAKIEKRLDELDDKLDKIIGKLDYIGATDQEKKCMNTDGSINYDAIIKIMDAITNEMKGMREDGTVKM
jgi:tetrahydromethanopterin S-methyltransferase subunit G